MIGRPTCLTGPGACPTMAAISATLGVVSMGQEPGVFQGGSSLPARVLSLRGAAKAAGHASSRLRRYPSKPNAIFPRRRCAEPAASAFSTRRLNN